MWKLLLALLLICPSAWASQWRNGTGEQTILGTSNAALIGYNSYNSIVQPLDNLLSGYCTEYLQYNSSSLINVVAGSCNVSNSQGTIHLFLQDTSNTVLSSSNLDTGSLTASTTYYVYATAATNAATTSTYYISASNTAPSGKTYYYQIGSFITDASNNITLIHNNWQYSEVGLPQSKSTDVVYQALTDGLINGNGTCSTNTGACHIYCNIGSTTSLGTIVSSGVSNGNNNAVPSVNCVGLVSKGYYYSIQTSNLSSTIGAYFTPLS